MSASAHTVVEAPSHSGFISGFVHPLFGLDHLAAMVAVGLWSALAARSAGRDLLWGPVGFAAMLLVGAVLGLQGVALPAVEPMIAASLLVTGLLVVSRLRVPGLVAALVVGVFAVFHGVAHGYELAGDDSAWWTLAGMLTATMAARWSRPNRGWAKPLRKLLWMCDSAPVWALAPVLIALAAMKRRAAVWRCESAMRIGGSTEKGG